MANISDLRFDDKNMNDHTEYGMSLLEKSLQDFGAGRSILIDKNNNIIAGNGIIEAAGNIGLEDMQIVETTGDRIVAVKRTDIELNSKKGRGLAMADNGTSAANLSWNKGNIEEVSEEFDINPGDWISDWDKDEDIEIEEDEAPEVNESEPAKSELGKVYKLGEHRLMCGDSTDAVSVAILMNGEKADLVFTSPPYNNGGNAIEKGSFKKGVKSQKLYGETGYSDSLSSDGYIEFCKKVLENAFAVTDGFIFWNVNYNAQSRFEYIKQIEDRLLYLVDQICWKKQMSITNTSGGLTRIYEPIYVFSTDMSPLKVKKPLTNHWEISNINASYEDHRACFPVALPKYALDNISAKVKIVFEPFCGSGSTLIASEQSGVKCYGMELDPHYCDVIRKRYWKFTHDGDEEGWEEGTPAI